MRAIPVKNLVEGGEWTSKNMEKIPQHRAYLNYKLNTMPSKKKNLPLPLPEAFKWDSPQLWWAVGVSTDKMCILLSVDESL